MLNALPFALLLRPATPGEKVDKLIKGVHKQFSNPKKEKGPALTEIKKKSLVLVYHRVDHRNEYQMVIVKHKCNCGRISLEDEEEENSDFSQEYNDVTKEMTRSTSRLEYGFVSLYETFVSKYKCVCNQQQKHFEKEMVEDFNDKGCQTEEGISNFKKNIQLIKSVIDNPLYLILCVTHVSFQWA